MPGRRPYAEDAAEKAELEARIAAEEAKPREKRDRWRVYQWRQRIWKINKRLERLDVEDLRITG
jgi:hypothetical protein